MKTLYEETPEEVGEEDFAKALQSDSSKKSFVIVDGEEELKRIMAEPLEKWRIFLHPTQRKIVNQDFSGPARVLGGSRYRKDCGGHAQDEKAGRVSSCWEEVAFYHLYKKPCR